MTPVRDQTLRSVNFTLLMKSMLCTACDAHLPCLQTDMMTDTAIALATGASSTRPRPFGEHQAPSTTAYSQGQLQVQGTRASQGVGS